MPATDDADLNPPWLVVMSLLPLICGIAVVLQRWNQPHLGWTIVLVAIAVVPLTLADVFSSRFEWIAGLPVIVLAIPVLFSVGVLIWNPV